MMGTETGMRTAPATAGRGMERPAWIRTGPGHGIARRLAIGTLSAALLLGGVGTALTLPAAAQDAPATATSYVAVEALNVRAQPTISGAIMGTLGYGEVVTVVGGPVAADGYTWFQLARDGVTLGWSVNGIAAGAPPGTGGNPAPIGQFKAGDTVSVNVDALNVRQTPSTGAAIVRVLAFGERVTLTGGGQLVGSDVWYPINGGWVAGAFLTAAVVTPPTTPPTTPPGGSFAYGQSVTVTASLLNGRATPSLSGGIIATYAAGQTLTITSEPRQADGITWYGVNDTAWVSGQYLAAATGGTTPPVVRDTLYVVVGVANVRSGPGTSNAIVGTLTYGQAVEWFDSSYDGSGQGWYAIDAAGTRWVYGDLVSLYR